MLSGKYYPLICPRCGEKHLCPRVWYMYQRPDDWYGLVCMFYCGDDSGSVPVFKLYTLDYKYVCWITDFRSSMSWHDVDEIPF